MAIFQAGIKKTMKAIRKEVRDKVVIKMKHGRLRPSSFYFLLQEGESLHQLLIIPGHCFIVFFHLVILG